MYGFGRERRLLKKSEYDHVFQQAKKITNSEFIFLFREGLGDKARMGLALSKKSVAKAHNRNRLKRMLRETFRLQKLPAIDVVVLARRGAEKTTNSDLITKLDQAWDKLSALCRN